jgi:hypothetical protein
MYVVCLQHSQPLCRCVCVRLGHVKLQALGKFNSSCCLATGQSAFSSVLFDKRHATESNKASSAASQKPVSAVRIEVLGHH